MFALLYASVSIAPLIAALSAIEIVASAERFTAKSRLRGFAFSILASITGGASLVLAISAFSLLGIHSLIRVPVAGMSGDAIACALSLIFSDLMGYWNHRFQHRFLWRIHSLHHCQTELHAANGYAHFSERAANFLLFALPLSLVHFDFPETPFAIGMLRGMLELYIHSPIPLHLGLLSWLFVDNRHHRVHHSLEDHHFDKNFGILFSFWDRLFGTYVQLEPGEWPATGVAGILPPASVADYLLFPLRRAEEPHAANVPESG